MADGKPSNCICKEHSGLVSDISTAQRNITSLWEKWNSMQKIIIAALVALVMNLVGVVVLLAKTLL